MHKAELADRQRDMKKRWTGKMDDYLHMEPSKERTFLALQLWGSWSDEYRAALAEQDKENQCRK